MHNCLEGLLKVDFLCRNLCRVYGWYSQFHEHTIAGTYVVYINSIHNFTSIQSIHYTIHTTTYAHTWHAFMDFVLQKHILSSEIKT